MSNAEVIAKARAKLLAEFIFHWRRRNLLPYDESFRGSMDALVAAAEEHFVQPVHPFDPMPEPKPIPD